MHERQRSNALVALSDGRAGNQRQAAALAAALAGHDVPHVSLLPHAPWRWLAPRRLPLAGHAYGTDFARLLADPPALAVGCGRQAALATRLLRDRGTRVVQVLDPRIAARHWDLLVVPEHDALRAANALTVAGSLNPVDDAWLERGRAAFAALGRLPSPRVALLLGGPTAQVPWREEQVLAAMSHLAAYLRRAGGSVLATASRRTPAMLAQALPRAFAGMPACTWRDARDGANPYAGLLGWAEAIVCTPDSANLLSEACATRAPVYVIAPECARGRIGRFVQALLRQGRVRAFDPALPPFEAVPLRETARVAAQVRTRLHLPG
jgi:mitochondrial fission protein ELM1